MTYPNEERIKEIATLIKQRDHALSMIGRWQQKVDEANSSLALMLGEAAVTNTETGFE